ncbi:non-ribosomal peptide synthetase [Actinomadura verrucosospora]|uniref:non-ribosomal peptide synthetase n=1 Tax=Actinomadura verrucosospora TaxID=46165 RepID=UPI0015636DBC|nr:non-ribosomal peptide synthetase [Actinomadura verrucosospora]
MPPSVRLPHEPSGPRGGLERTGSPGPGGPLGGDRALAALAALLHRYSGEKELLVGRVVAGSPDRVQPLRLTVDPDAPAAELVEQAGRVLRDAEERGALAAAELLSLRDCDQPCHALLIEGDGAQAPPLADVAVVLGEEGAVTAVAAGRFDAASAARLAAHYANLAEGVTEHPETALDRVPMLTDAECAEALVEWNDTDEPVAAATVPELIEQVAARTPGRTAVRDADRAATYGELDADANRLANHLRAQGVTGHDRVAVLLERGVWSVLAQLAVFKLGAAVVLLDAEYPEARLGFMVDDTEAAAVITRSALAGRVAVERTVTVDTGEWRAAPAERPEGTGVVEPADDSVSHIAFTSGSTGTPKAVQLRHGPFRNTVGVLIRQCGITADARGTWLCSPGFGLVEVDFFPVLAAGGTVLVPAPETAASAEALRDWLVEERVTHTLQLTAMAERLWTLPWPAGCALRSMRVAGERVRGWPSPDLPYSVLNVYGSAEANVVATCDLTAVAGTLPEDGRAARNVPIGRPVANVRAYVLDRHQRPVPRGVLGELYISGASLSRGYLNRPGANSEKFTINPIPDDPYPVLYRSGDVARYWPDGTIEIVGRLDDEVKIRGYRVHPGEVESVLAAQPGVRQCAVVAREDVPGERRLVAYVEPDRGAPPLVRELRRALRAVLPPYMLPSAFVVGDLPSTSNGKIDRGALPVPPRSRPDLDTPYQEPRNADETALAELWSQVLAVDGIGVLDDFFELGGDSLLAMRLLSRMAERSRVEFGMADFYDAPSIRQMARVLATRREAGRHAETTVYPVIEPDAERRYEPFPLTETQQALWIGRGGAVEYGDVGCHGYFEWERDGLDVDRFRTAWGRLMERHDMLRTVIRPDGTQQILPVPPHDPVTVTDLRGLPGEESLARADEIRAEMSHQVMDPSAWPLFDVRLTRLRGGRVRLHIGIDLLLMDAWSAFQVLFPDLIELYENPDGELPPLGIGFRDYIVEGQRILKSSADYERSKRYWLDRLPALPAAPDLPMIASPKEPVLFDRRECVVGPDRWKRLKDRANASGVTPSGILVAAFAEVLRTWSRNDRFTVNFPIFDRMPLHPQIEHVLGDFTNTLLVAVEKTDGTFEERARDLQAQLWQDLEHRHFNGVEVLREIARRDGGALRPAMPVVVTSLLGHPPRRQVSALGEETYGISQTPQVTLDFQIREIDAALHFKWDFLAALYPAGMIDAMFSAYRGLIDALIDDPEAWGRECFELVPAEQLARRAAVNDTAAGVRPVLLHEILAEQAARRPDAPVVVSGRRRLGYGELYAEANRIGRGLRERGVRPGELVAVVTEKGWEAYPAVYGVLASGAAYLPIDAGVPADRLAHLTASAGVRIALTQPWLVDRLQWPEGVEVLAVGDGSTGHDFVGYGTEPLDTVQTAGDLAYTIYTSGSTGVPKGVAVDHAGVVNMVDDVNRRLGVGPSDRGFGAAGLHFDMSVYDVFGIVAAGASIVLPDPFTRPDPDAWLDLVARESVTFWSSVPALLEIVVDRADARRDGALESVRTVVLSGDWIPLTLPDRMRGHAPRARIFSSGGPTETICWSILYEVGEVDPDWASIPYGTPIANQRYHIVDGRYRHRPDWVPGEMVVASEVGLAHGYHRDEERTARRFFRLPGTGERVYATGDIGRYLPDGNIEILGRDDFQVKVQGHRIELGEIEAVLERHPQVQTAVAVAPANAEGRRHLTAFVVPAPGAEPAAERLGAFLTDRLPAYMVPADLRVVEELPLTGNGKLDRRALTEQAARHEAAEDDGPATPLETLLCGLCAEVLGLPEVGPGGNFFQLGGDSLSGTRLVSRINETFAAEVPLRTVFTSVTMRDLAAALAADPEYGEVMTAFADALVNADDDELARMVGDDAADTAGAA